MGDSEKASKSEVYWTIQDRPHDWVAVKELNLSYYIGKPFFTIYTHNANLI